MGWLLVAALWIGVYIGYRERMRRERYIEACDEMDERLRPTVIDPGISPFELALARARATTRITEMFADELVPEPLDLGVHASDTECLWTYSALMENTVPIWEREPHGF